MRERPGELALLNDRAQVHRLREDGDAALKDLNAAIEGGEAALRDSGARVTYWEVCVIILRYPMR